VARTACHHLRVLALALKLVLAPALIGVATIAARRWGPAAAGWAASLPVVGGPLLLVIALEHSPEFTARAAAAATAGLVSLAVFGVTYVRFARADVPWWGSLPAGWVAFGVSTAAVWAVDVPVGIGVAAVIACSASLRRLLGPAHPTVPTRRRLPLDLPLRMTAGAAMVVALSAVSPALGPRLTGLLAPFPVIASVLAAFTHSVDGIGAVGRYADALVRGLPSFAAFTAAVAWLVRPEGTAIAFAVASLAALGSHVILITRR
jgi:hypothetical protein